MAETSLRKQPPSRSKNTAIYKGDLLIGISFSAVIPFHIAAKDVLDNSQYSHRVFYTVDGESGAPATRLSHLEDRLNTKQLVYSVGISACAIKDSTGNIRQAQDSVAQGDALSSIIWTLDSSDSMRKHLDLGVHGVLTNHPSK